MNKQLEIKEPDTLEGSKHPRLAKKLVGHKKAWQTFLKCKVKGKLHHAWIISGPKGIGKATFSWKIASNLINNPKEGIDKEEKTPSLSDLFLCRRNFDDKTNRLKKFITVDEIRRLKSFFQMTATEYQWRIVIIDCADELNKSAANALLKILEEPPSRSIFLIIANQPEKLSVTIRSRCRTLNLNKLTKTEIKQVLEISNYNFEDMSQNDQNILSILADGSAGLAMTAINNEGITDFKKCLEILAGFPHFERTKIVKLADKVRGKNESFMFLSSIILSIISRLALIAIPTKGLLLTDEEKLLMEKIPKKIAMAQTLAQLYISLLKSFLSCSDLNLDYSSHVVNAFVNIESAMTDC